MKHSKALKVFLYSIGIITVLWLTIPTLLIIPVSFTGQQSFAFPPKSWSFVNYENFFSNPAWIDSLILSIKIAVVVTVISTVVGTLASYALVIKKFRGSEIFQGVFLAPLIVPGIVVAVAVYLVFLTTGLVGTFWGYVGAHCVLAIPFVVVNVTASLTNFDTQLLRAGANLGASPLTVFRKITLPIILPGVFAGAIFAFVTSFDEVVVSLFIQAPGIQTLPVKMFISVANEVDPTIAAAATIVLLISASLLAVANMRNRKE